MSVQVEGIEGVFVVATPAGVSPVVLISLKDGRSLPIYIGLWEAISISSVLRSESPPRPFTHDLFAETLQKFHIVIQSLQIDSLEDGVYYATLLLNQDNQNVRIDCRPSDGIALALRCKAPIFVDETVLGAAAVNKDELPKLADLASYLNA
jgi:bifunctional DNase/RNase